MRDIQRLFGYGEREFGYYVFYVAVQDLYSAFSLVARERNGGVVDAVGNIPVFDVVDKLVRSHDRAVVFGFGRACAQVGHAYAVFNADELCVGEVGYVPADFAALKGGYDVVGIHKLAAAVVDDDYAVLHLSYGILVYHALGVGSGGGVYRYKICGFIYLFARGHNFYVGGERKRVERGEVGVGAAYLHAQAVRRVGDFHAYGAEAYNAQHLALYLAAHEL